jgi:hypothetical protein
MREACQGAAGSPNAHAVREMKSCDFFPDWLKASGRVYATSSWLGRRAVWVSALSTAADIEFPDACESRSRLSLRICECGEAAKCVTVHGALAKKDHGELRVVLRRAVDGVRSGAVGSASSAGPQTAIGGPFSGTCVTWKSSNFLTTDLSVGCEQIRRAAGAIDQSVLVWVPIAAAKSEASVSEMMPSRLRSAMATAWLK